MKLIFTLLLCLPLMAKIADPGEGLPTAAQRRIARLEVWQPQWAGLSAAGKKTFAYNAFYDIAQPYRDCLLTNIRDLNDAPYMTVAEAKVWIEEQFQTWELTTIPDWVIGNCASTQTEAVTGTGGDGGSRDTVLIIANHTVAKALRAMLPFLPRIGSVPPVSFSAPVIEASPGTRVAYRWDAQEVHLHLLEAIVRAEGKLGAFSLRRPDPAVYDSEGTLVTPEVTPLPEDWVN